MNISRDIPLSESENPAAIEGWLDRFEAHCSANWAPWFRKVFDEWEAIFGEPGRALWPAAKGHHHAWPGGLLAHTASVLRLSLVYAAMLRIHHGARLDFQVIASAALFHDVGKLFEVSGEPGGDYQPAGAIVGHIAISRSIWLQVAERCLVPTSARGHVVHCIDAHHSNAGAVATQPMTPEACVLSMADSMDSRVVGMLDAIDRPAADRPRHFRHAARWPIAAPPWIGDANGG